MTALVRTTRSQLFEVAAFAQELHAAFAAVVETDWVRRRNAQTASS